VFLYKIEKISSKILITVCKKILLLHSNDIFWSYVAKPATAALKTGTNQNGCENVFFINQLARVFVTELYLVTFISVMLNVILLLKIAAAYWQ
jgi:hypothetical protein